MSDQADAMGGRIWEGGVNEQAFRRCRSLVNAISDGVFRLDADGRFVAVDDGLVELTGLTHGDLLGEDVSVLIADSGGDSGIEDVISPRHASATGDQPREIAVNSIDGDRIPCELYIDRAVTGGDYEGALGAVRDISEQKARERDLERFETTVHAVWDGVTTLDAEDRFVMVNEAFCEMTGYDRDDLLGEHATLVLDEADYEEAGELHDRVAEGELDSAMLEYDLQTADGESIPVEARFGPCEFGDGTIGGTGVIRDVSDRKAHERRLERSEQRYRALVEHFPNGAVALVDETLRYQTVGGQPLEAVDATADEVEGEPVKEIVPPELEDELVTGYEAALEGNSSTFKAESDGRFYQFQIVPVRDNDGEVFAALGTSQDISEEIEVQRKLEESERRYRTLVENFPNGAVGLFDEDLEYTAVGGQLLDALGVDPEERVGRSIPDIHPDGLLERIEPFFHAALDGEGTSFEVEFNGRHLSADILPVRNADDEINAGMLVVQDVTERIAREQELAQYETLFEESKDVNVIVEPDGTFRYLTPSAANVFGYEPEELVGEVGFEYIHPDDRDAALAEFTAMIESADYEPKIEFRFEHKDGTWIVLEALARDLREDPDIGGVVVYTRDVTERKEYERELERALDLLEKTERTADVGGWEIDVDSGEVFWSEHLLDLLEVPHDEEPRLDEALNVYHEDDRSIVEDAVDEALHSGEPFDVEARFQTPSGEVRWLRVQGVPELADGDVVSLRGAAQDITERKEREQQLEELVDRLEESNERLEQFAHAASHDLQEPLRMVSSYLQLIELRYGDDLDEDGREFLEFAVDGADRMRTMIDGLLQYSRVERQGEPFEPVDLNEVVDAVITDLDVQITESNADITVDELPRVEGDERQLRQVFQNLLDNAIEYSGEDPPRVTVAATRDGDEHIVSVRDEGIGIEPQQAERVFEVFHRLHSREEYDGTGLGLALCQRVIERHGGEIWVESDVGEGATFYLSLPTAGAAE